MAHNQSFSDKKPKDSSRTLKRTLAYLSGKKYLLFGVIILSIVANILSLLGPSFAGSAMREADAGAGNVNFQRVYYFTLRMIIVYLSSSALTLIINTLMQHISKWVAWRMRRDVFNKLMILPVSFFDTNSTGDIISRVSYDIDVVSTCIATDVTHIVTNLVSVIGALIAMLVISPVLSLIVIVTIPLSVFYTARIRKQVRPRFSKRSRSYGKLNGFVEEMFSGQKTIQGYAREDKICDSFETVNDAAAAAYYDAEYYSCTMGPTMNCINNIGLGLIAFFGCIMYMSGSADIGSISSFVLYSRKFSGPINEIANVVNEMFSALSAAERVFNLLDESREPEDFAEASVLEDVNGRVELNNVSFGYTPDKTVLHSLSLLAKPGKTVAIVGPTGAGKTTIINLLMRFYDASGGEISVDEKEIKTLTRRSLRSAYAMVLQDTWVFNGTIYENIAYGKAGASREEVVAAAKCAHIHSFIMRLPEGYDTVISEDGGNISKGQKQLLTIARAMLYDARMLILDEATSNVDTGTEREVQKAMRFLMKGKTCFVIAHRLSTIRNADFILVVNNGDVVESGNHKELMEKQGFYYSLYSSQFS